MDWVELPFIFQGLLQELARVHISLANHERNVTHHAARGARGAPALVWQLLGT